MWDSYYNYSAENCLVSVSDSYVPTVFSERANPSRKFIHACFCVTYVVGMDSTNEIN